MSSCLVLWGEIDFSIWLTDIGEIRSIINLELVGNEIVRADCCVVVWDVIIKIRTWASEWVRLEHLSTIWNTVWDILYYIGFSFKIKNVRDSRVRFTNDRGVDWFNLSSIINTKVWVVNLWITDSDQSWVIDSEDFFDFFCNNKEIFWNCWIKTDIGVLYLNLT